MILLLPVCLMLLLGSCADNIAEDVAKSGNTPATRDVTFALSQIGDSHFDVTTRSNGTAITDKYVVQLYLFKARNGSDGYYDYILERIEPVRVPLFTIRNLETMSLYKIVFLAVPAVQSEALNVIDFASVNMTSGGEWPIQIPTANATPSTTPTNGSLLENCYVSFFDDAANSVPNYGGGRTQPVLPETIQAERELEIFGYGSELYPGMTYSTPVNVLLKRQYGIVEFRYTDAQPGDKLTCSFSSDYYRLYISQIVQEIKANSDTQADTEPTYKLDNEAVFPSNVFDALGHETGDYYSASCLFRTNQRGLPVFSKTVTLNAGENSIRVYMPFTTVARVGTEVEDIYKANFIRTDLLDGNGSSIYGPYGDIVLKVERGGELVKEFKLEATTFPIYRNGTTVFTTVGETEMRLTFTGNGGIDLDDDSWDGIVE